MVSGIAFYLLLGAAKTVTAEEGGKPIFITWMDTSNDFPTEHFSKPQKSFLVSIKSGFRCDLMNLQNNTSLKLYRYKHFCQYIFIIIRCGSPPTHTQASPLVCTTVIDSGQVSVQNMLPWVTVLLLLPPFWKRTLTITSCHWQSRTFWSSVRFC